MQVDETQNPELTKLFTECAVNIFPSYDENSVTITERTWEASTYERAEALQAMLFTGNITTSGAQVTVEFNEAQDIDAMQALQEAAKDATGIHVSYSAQDITFHASADTVIERLNGEKFKYLLKRKLG